MDFGNLSHLFAGMLGADRNAIAYEVGLLDRSGAGHGGALTNVMQALNYVRNICAHHARLWNRNMTVEIAPKNLIAVADLSHLKGGERTKNSRIYGVLCVLAYLMDRVSPGHTWKRRLIDLLRTAMPSTQRHPAEMGFPEDWLELSVWLG